MTASASILPNPKMYFVDPFGKPLGGGNLYTQRSDNKTVTKLTFQDPGMQLAYPNPIPINADGTVGPVFWAADVPYYIYVTDLLGNTIWTMDGFGPAIAGGGGGGSVTTVIDLENLVLNNAFYRNSYNVNSNTISVTPLPTFLKLAPGAHAGFSGYSQNATGLPESDICFAKSNTAATDSLSFGIFPVGTSALTGDITPVYYLHYESTAGNETYKYVQFPICSDVQNLSGQAVNGKLWYRYNSGDPNLNIYTRQFFGDGPSASAQIRTLLTTVPMNTDGAWHQYLFTGNIPNATGTLGECGNDGLFVQIEFPTNSVCNVDITKLSLYLGAATPAEDFHSNDQVESIVNDFRTGDIRTSLNSFEPFGWVAMRDGTIGSRTSGATARANRDTYPLYALLWSTVADTYAPVSTGRGANPAADFAANKTIALTKQLGRVITGNNSALISSLTFTVADFTTDLLTVSSTANLPTGTPLLLSNSGGALPTPLVAGTIYYVINQSATTLKLAISVDRAEAGTAVDLTDNGTGTQTILPALGAYFGEGSHVLTVDELASHTHTQLGGGSAGTITYPFINSAFTDVQGGKTEATGGNQPHNTMQPSVMQNIFIKL